MKNIEGKCTREWIELQKNKKEERNDDKVGEGEQGKGKRLFMIGMKEKMFLNRNKSEWKKWEINRERKVINKTEYKHEAWDR